MTSTTATQAASFSAPTSNLGNRGANTTLTTTEANTTSSTTMKQENNNSSSWSHAVTSKWKSSMDSLREGVSYVVLVVTHHAASNPIAYLISILCLSLGLLGIGFLTNFDMTVEAPTYLTPTHSVIVEQRQWIEDESNFPPKPHSLRILVHNQGENVLTEAGIWKTFEVVDQIQQTPGYPEFCQLSEAINTAGYGGLCHIRGMPLLWNHSKSLFEDSVSSSVDLLLQVSADKYPDGSDIDPRELMGHMTHLNGTLAGKDIIETAQSFLMEVVVPATPDGSKSLAIDILHELQDLKKSWTDSNPSSGYRLELFLIEHSLESETVRAVFYDLPLIPSVFVIMALFTCLVFSTSSKPGGKRCQPRFLLGFGAVATILLSMATSYGLLFIIGVPFTSLTQILPFIMFGIGLDDSFIIYGEYIRTDDTKDPVQRVKDTFQEVGLSITLTTMTTTLAFGLGCFASVPTLIWLSLYAFPTVIIDFIYQITFFVAILVIDEGRIAKRQKPNEDESQPSDKDNEAVGVDEERHVEPQGVSDDKASQSKLIARDNDKEDGHKEGKGKHLAQGVELQAEGQPQYHHHSPGPPTSAMDRFMKDFADILLTKPAKIIVLLGFLTLTVVFAFAASNFKQEFNIYEVLMEDSYLASYFKSLNQYAETGFVLPKAYFRNVDQSNPNVQREMQDYLDDLLEIDAITRPPPFFWLDHFKEFLAYDDRLLDLTFNQQMDIFLSVDAFRILYGDHIVRDENGNVVASRVLFTMDNVDVEDVGNQIDAWRAQLNVTEKQPINSEANREEGEGFNFFLHDEELLYTFEFYSVFVDELILSSILGVSTVTLVAFLFLPHWSAPCFLAPIISVLYIDLIGFLQLCGVHLNAISYFTLVCSIGLLVDFNMHVLLRYYESPCRTREGKVKDALQTMGSSVVIGGLSTFLGVVPLLFSTSSFMKTLFYGFWGMVLLGCGHGVIVLPVILSFVGPLNTCTVNASVPLPSDAESSTRSIEQSKHVDMQSDPRSTSASCPSSVDTTRPRESHAELCQAKILSAAACKPRVELDDAHLKDERQVQSNLGASTNQLVPNTPLPLQEDESCEIHV